MEDSATATVGPLCVRGWWNLEKRIVESLGITVLMVVLVFMMATTLFGRWRHPYGRSENALFFLSLALSSYASQNDGMLPFSLQGPEAALTPLAEHDLEGLGPSLRGKTVSLQKTMRRLRSGGQLDAETCGWHYVQGLRTTDPGRIAVMWDKVGLGNRGERIPGGGHEVLYLNGQREIVPLRDWGKFLAYQDDLYEVVDLNQRLEQMGWKSRSE